MSLTAPEKKKEQQQDDNDNDDAPKDSILPPKGYVPKWKKKATLAELTGGTPTDLTQIGLKGDIPVVFKQGNQTRSTIAFSGQPLRDVATQAGQYIKYGCGKGECGTCECLANGQCIRPCMATVPALPSGQTYTVTVKQIKNKSKSSGKFYSVRSFLMGFYNNAIGMIGFVKARRDAARSWRERKEYDRLIQERTLEKKRMKMLEQQQQQQASGGGQDNNNNNKLSP